MPAVYVSGIYEVDINVPQGDEIFDQWTDATLAEQRKEYGHGNVGFWLEIENSEDPLCPFAIPIYEIDSYEGGLTVTRKDRIFTFKLSGKFKVNVSKLTKAKIEAGMKPKLVSVSVNGRSWGLESQPYVSFILQSKKL
jgi:hypothetical protein